MEKWWQRIDDACAFLIPPIGRDELPPAVCLSCAAPEGVLNLIGSTPAVNSLALHRHWRKLALATGS
jgi:hypothetical protein